jgi:ABC-type Fe3+/spermidine/putrescine transport system ATPase subunit
MIAGFIEPYAGTVTINGNVMNAIPAYKRNVGIFFQNYALFPHMTVTENVAFSLKMKKMKKNETQKKVDDILSLVKLDGMGDRYPRQLSGGQQQRVALARALVMEPDVLLLDEPLSNLDAKLRQEMQVEIKRIQKELKLTTIIVTHDQEEAVSLANRVVIMNEGEIEQIGQPSQVFNQPAHPFVADFMGFANFVQGKLAAKEGNVLQIKTPDGAVMQQVYDRADQLDLEDEVVMTIRPEAVLISAVEKEGYTRGKLVSMTYKGHHTLVDISSSVHEKIQAINVDMELPEEGEAIYFAFPSDKVIVYKN